ncbi:hypothetical protein [Jiella avicenniae]|uniref:Uncharacterized protein n=1 Tax=Jiella avicenniae TaxID=2907202 RepID=A0A9X1T4X6_9HYPH|nr:hypothetical protein [Jiella avicenniae]MCE7028482.1 hypothetical protein [Jiella avicenniae]
MHITIENKVPGIDVKVIDVGSETVVTVQRGDGLNEIVTDKHPLDIWRDAFRTHRAAIGSGGPEAVMPASLTPMGRVSIGAVVVAAPFTETVSDDSFTIVSVDIADGGPLRLSGD